jgi:hypothetical protein
MCIADSEYQAFRTTVRLLKIDTGVLRCLFSNGRFFYLRTFFNLCKTINFKVFFLLDAVYCCWLYWGFGLRALHLLGRHSTT